MVRLPRTESLHGLAVPKSMNKEDRTAVLVIDMLVDYFADSPLSNRKDDLVTNINSLVNGARSHRFPVIWVRQEFAADLSDAFLVMRREEIHMTIEQDRKIKKLEEKVDAIETQNITLGMRLNQFYRLIAYNTMIQFKDDTAMTQEAKDKLQRVVLGKALVKEWHIVEGQPIVPVLMDE